MTQQHRFLVALRRLQDWYADSVAAQSMEGRTSSSKPGSVHLRLQQYPGARDALDAYRHASPPQREEIIESLEAEYTRLGRSHVTVTYRDYWGKTRYRLLEPA